MGDWSSPRLARGAGLAALGLLLAACAGPRWPAQGGGVTASAPPPQPAVGGTATVPPSPTAASMVSPTPASMPGAIDPLTGLVADPRLLERRPLLIKVSNFPVSGRPHSGLSYADLVWEYTIGEGMTRFLALYYGRDASKVGPIRSGRLVDAQITRMYGGILGMKGADAGVWRSLSAALGDRVQSARPVSCPALCQYDESYTTSTFSDTAAFSRFAVSQGIDNRRPDLSGMAFVAELPEGGKPGTRLYIAYSFNDRVGWDYDPASGAYLRSQDKADDTGTLYPMPDQLTGKQLAFSNVVVVFAPHNAKSPTLIEIELWGAKARPALIFRDGQVYQVTYSAASTDLPLHFSTPDGQPFTFKPGSTWFEILSAVSTVKEAEPGFWKVRFY